MDWAAAHAGFVIAAYGLSALVIIGLAAIVVITDRARARQVKALEEQGRGRRSRAP